MVYAPVSLGEFSSVRFRASFAVQNGPANFFQNASQFITLCLVVEMSRFHLPELLGLGGPSQAPSNLQGESNMYQIVVAVSCRLCPPLPEGEFAVFRYRKTPCFYGKSYYFYRISCMNPLLSLSGKLGAKGDAKWWTSIRCMFDSLTNLRL